jgi:hypothetical protein
MKNTKKNFINAILAGALVFGCSCTLCNKKYGTATVIPQISTALQQIINNGKGTVSTIRQIFADMRTNYIK